MLAPASLAVQHLRLLVVLMGAIPCLCSLAPTQIAPFGPPPPLSQATVYRDQHGVPHIEAPTEAAAWYALGYEEARDALLYIQISAKRVRGQAVMYLYDPVLKARLAENLLSDMLVDIMGTYPTTLNSTQLRAMFAPSDQSITANFYDLCVAYAAGVNAYRELVALSNPNDPNSPEGRLKAWLQSQGANNGMVDFSWVYEEPVNVLDFLWYGRWTNAYLCTVTAMFKNASVNSIGSSFTDMITQVDATDPEIIPAPSTDLGMRRMEALKELLAGFPGMGSNSFCWTNLYCQETSGGTTVNYSGLMADPHGGNFAGTYGNGRG